MFLIGLPIGFLWIRILSPSETDHLKGVNFYHGLSESGDIRSHVMKEEEFWPSTWQDPIEAILFTTDSVISCNEIVSNVGLTHVAHDAKRREPANIAFDNDQTLICAKALTVDILCAGVPRARDMLKRTS